MRYVVHILMWPDDLRRSKEGYPLYGTALMYQRNICKETNPEKRILKHDEPVFEWPDGYELLNPCVTALTSDQYDRHV